MRRCHTLAFVSGLWVNACLNRQLHIGASAMASSGNRRRMTPIARDRRPSQGSAPKRKFYAVQKGMNNFSGVVTSWDECKLYVNGVSGAKFKSFSTYEEALHFSQPTGRPNVQVIGGFQRKALSSARGVERALPQADDDASANAAEEIFDDVPFVLSEAGEPQPNAPRVITVYTDGACTGNGQRGSKAGYGVFFGEGSPYNVSEPLEGRPTNQRAEMKAALEALSVIRERGLVAKRGLVQLYTDSKYTKLGIESWVSNWKRNNWKTSKGQPVLNKDLWIALHTTEQALKREGIRTKIFWVKGHSGIPGNEAADRLAVAGINRG